MPETAVVEGEVAVAAGVAVVVVGEAVAVAGDVTGQEAVAVPEEEVVEIVELAVVEKEAVELEAVAEEFAAGEWEVEEVSVVVELEAVELEVVELEGVPVEQGPGPLDEELAEGRVPSGAGPDPEEGHSASVRLQAQWPSVREPRVLREQQADPRPFPPQLLRC